MCNRFERQTQGSPKAKSHPSRPLVWGFPATGGSRAGSASGTWQEAPGASLRKFLLLSPPGLHSVILSKLWMGLLGFLGTWVTPPTTSWSPLKFWLLTGITGPERPSNSPGATQQAFWQRTASGLGAGSEQRYLTGGQCQPLLPGTEQVLHVHSHHTTQLQALQERQ